MNLKLNYPEEYAAWNKKYITFVEQYCNSHKGNYVVEGTQLFMTMEPEHFKGEPMIIMQTSAWQSFFRRMKRQLKKEEKKHPFTIGKKHILKLVNDSKRLHYRDAKKLNIFIEKLRENNNLK